MKYDVQLIRFGTAVHQPAAELRKIFPIDEQLAESIVRDLPKVVKRNADRQVAEAIAKALRDLGAEVECHPARDIKTPTAGSLPPPSLRRSAPSDRPERRMKATAVAGSFLPSDAPPGPPSAEDGPEPLPPAAPAASSGMPELALDFDAALRPGGSRPVGRGGSSAPPPPAIDDDAPALRPPPQPAPLSYRPPASDAPPPAVGPSAADAAEHRDKIVAAALLGLVLLAMGYRFVTYEPPRPGVAESEEAGSLEQQVARGELVDAAAHLEAGGEILTADDRKMSLRELVDKLYAAGAVKVWAEPTRAMRDLRRGGMIIASALVVELPGDPDVLDPIVGEYAVWTGRMANTISVEELESHDLGPRHWRLRTDLE